jgi:hypothetical protein
MAHAVKFGSEGPPSGRVLDRRWSQDHQPEIAAMPELWSNHASV